ncbi:hypothetical protein ACJX0J_030931, partial [Zea mays]
EYMHIYKREKQAIKNNPFIFYIVLSFPFPRKEDEHPVVHLLAKIEYGQPFPKLGHTCLTCVSQPRETLGGLRLINLGEIGGKLGFIADGRRRWKTCESIESHVK